MTRTPIAARVAALRAQFKNLEVDAVLVPHADEYQNEYQPACSKRLEWLTGFTGSAGEAAILKNQAALFVDGRYTNQAPRETDTSVFHVKQVNMRIEVINWLTDKLPANARIGFNPWLHTQEWLEIARKRAAKKNQVLVPLPINPVDRIWTDRPAEPLAPFFPHPLKFAGESARDKRRRIGKTLGQQEIDAFALTSPASVAWLLNIRGSDVDCTPLPLSRAVLHADGTVDLFTDPRKVGSAVRRHLGPDVTLHRAGSFPDFIAKLSRQVSVAADPTSAAAALFVATSDRLVRLTDPCVLPRALKNPIEQAGARAAHIRDGAALSTFLASIKAGDDELGLMARLQAQRERGEHFHDLSFETIAGSGPHGAIVHYKSGPATNRRLKNGEFLLLDSGAQYLDGTTDVTRTVAIGKVTPEMKDRYTRVLKAHIALASAVFPEDTTGRQIDALARQFLWQAGLNYGHGTGHGVGSFLSVHEGPHYIGPGPMGGLAPLRPGMIVSNEPGYYKKDRYGIRTESLLLVREVRIPGAEQKMLGFETLTLAPIDTRPVVIGLLSRQEKDWLNAYHRRVLAEVGPLVDPATRSWLKTACQPIGRAQRTSVRKNRGPS